MWPICSAGSIGGDVSPTSAHLGDPVLETSFKKSGASVIGELCLVTPYYFDSTSSQMSMDRSE